MISIKQAKARARTLNVFMKEQGVTLPHGVYLEAVARLEQHKNWATLLAEAQHKASFIKTREEVEQWPTYVLFIEENADTLEETLCVLPRGATLRDPARQQASRWRPAYSTEDAVPAPEAFVLSNQVVVTDVYATIPAVDKYGLPAYADEEKAPAFFREALGCAAVEGMEVYFSDLRDDSAGTYWFQARVHPDQAKLLDAALALAHTEVDLGEQARQVVLARVFQFLPEQVSFADVLLALEVTSDEPVNGQACLQAHLHWRIALRSPYAELCCPELQARLSELARTEFEALARARSEQ
jgi:hypothetical protein